MQQTNAKQISNIKFQFNNEGSIFIFDEFQFMQIMDDVLLHVYQI